MKVYLTCHPKSGYPIVVYADKARAEAIAKSDRYLLVEADVSQTGIETLKKLIKEQESSCPRGPSCKGRDGCPHEQVAWLKEVINE